MTLTRHQIHERLGGLSGEIKAAREQKRLTAQDLVNREHEVSLARQADERAQGHVDRLEAEARALTAQYAAAVDELIAPAMAGEAFDAAVAAQPFNSIFSEPADFQAQALANGESRINQAYDEATR